MELPSLEAGRESPPRTATVESAQHEARPSFLFHSDDWLVEKLLSAHLHRFCEWHVHPNAITGVSLAVAAGIPVLHFCRLSWWVAAGLIVRQVLDCLDGAVARRCRKTSRLGGLLDAVGDTIFFFAILILLVSPLASSPKQMIVISCLSFAGLVAIHLSQCRPSELVDHSLKTYRTRSPWRKSYAYLVNNSLVFALLLALAYKLWVRHP